MHCRYAQYKPGSSYVAFHERCYLQFNNTPNIELRFNVNSRFTHHRTLNPLLMRLFNRKFIQDHLCKQQVKSGNNKLHNPSTLQDRLCKQEMITQLTQSCETWMNSIFK